VNLAVLTVRLSPEIDLGPVSIAWHGLTIAVGIVLAGWFAGRSLRARGLDTEPLGTVLGLVAVCGLVGGRIFYVLEHGGPLLGARGFTFDGGLILSTIVLVAYVRRAGLPTRYLDVLALWFPLGLAVGRIGDVINGEHYGARSTSFLAVRNANPAALTPDPRFAYENGGLYEVLLALIVLGAIWGLRPLARRPGDLVFLMIGLLSVGRFFEFFLRSDSPSLALGLNNAQWTSIALLAAVLVARAWLSRRPRSRLAEYGSPRA